MLDLCECQLVYFMKIPLILLLAILSGVSCSSTQSAKRDVLGVPIDTHNKADVLEFGMMDIWCHLPEFDNAGIWFNEAGAALKSGDLCLEDELDKLWINKSYLSICYVGTVCDSTELCKRYASWCVGRLGEEEDVNGVVIYGVYLSIRSWSMTHSNGILGRFEEYSASEKREISKEAKEILKILLDGDLFSTPMLEVPSGANMHNVKQKILDQFSTNLIIDASGHAERDGRVGLVGSGASRKTDMP